MRFLLITIMFTSLNSWAGLEVQHCSNGNLNYSINLCFESPLYRGKIDINGEKIVLNFTDEDQPKSKFILASGQSTIVQLLGSEALLQIEEETPIWINCGLFVPGYCK